MSVCEGDIVRGDVDGNGECKRERERGMDGDGKCSRRENEIDKKEREINKLVLDYLDIGQTSLCM